MLPPKTSSLPDHPPVGQFLDLGGRRIFLDRAGQGAPSVVFLPGAGMFGLGYYNVHREAANLTTSVIYDRGGTGWSGDVELPRSATAVVDELRAVLQIAEIPGPYLFVGHSLGGLYARRYAQRFPEEVAGMLLLDPAHEDFSSYLSEDAKRFLDEWKQQPPPEITEEMIQGYRGILGGMYAAWPDEIREALVERHFYRVTVGMAEGKNVEELYEEVRHGGPTPAVPLIVYTAMGIDDSQRFFSPEEIIRAQNAAKLAANQALVRTVPGAECRVLEDASHAMLHAQRPDAVIQGIRDVLERVRR